MKLHRSFSYNVILSFTPEELIALVAVLPPDQQPAFAAAVRDARAKIGKTPQKPRKETT